MKKDITVACYYFPNYHVDSRNEVRYGKGWTEWELVKQAVPRFPGHVQPKQPLWGYQDEAAPEVMAHKIDAAADHAIDVFIFDWYWYNDGPFLNRCLEDGFLGAHNNQRLKFALMWANHDWVDIHPASLGARPELLYPGTITEAAFDYMTDYIVKTYFKHPNYWKIDGCPYFSVYELSRFVKGFGCLEQASEAIKRFRQKVKAAGFRDLHLNAVTWGIQILPGEKRVANLAEMLAYLAFDSTTSYVWSHHVLFDQFPTVPYEKALTEYLDYARSADAKLGLPYFPNVTMGWDSTPRTIPTAPYENTGYPYMSTLANNSPENFRRAMIEVKCLLDKQADTPKILTINSWNEWTEGSYLEPDKLHGMAYLQAVASAGFEMSPKDTEYAKLKSGLAIKGKAKKIIPINSFSDKPPARPIKLEHP